MDRLRSECMSCMVKNIGSLPPEIPEKKKLAYMQRVFGLLADAAPGDSAPLVVWRINQLKEQMLGLRDEYAELKRHFNAFMMGFAPDVRQRIAASADRLRAAMQFSLVGNYIDFGAMQQVDEGYLRRLLDSAGSIRIDENKLENLKKDLKTGRKLLFITDNCGEIVMDRLLIETIQALYPQLAVTALVRGMPVLNDATREDAVQTGLDTVCTVLDNGTGVAGTCLDRVPDEILQEVQTSDLILAKGQGNFETLRGCGHNVYYLFLCKCDMFAHQFGVEKFTGMLVQDAECRL